ncbi:MAG: ABC transporter permease [Phycisphaerae bacterium]|nr:ABC transporter permease [Phycisphaerae bacterium]MDW8261849.1 ABC transporter permease [Phycisphaerales bacterium]
MNKTLIVASREYLAAVKSKGFVIGIILMPVMMFGGLIVGRLTRDIEDITDKRVAVIDRTPGATIASTLIAAAEKRNAEEIFDPQTRRQKSARFLFEKVDPAPLEDPGAVAEQRWELSQRVRRNELFAFVEIGKDIFAPTEAPRPTTQEARALQDEVQRAVARLDFDAIIEAQIRLQGENNIVRYTSNRPTYRAVRDFVQKVVTQVVIPRRMAGRQVDWDALAALSKPPLVGDSPLYEKDRSGTIRQEAKQGQMASIIVPLAMLLLMFLTVLIGSSQLATNVVEEKQLRIAEVLLGSVRPFELMMGKLLGGVGVALTLAAVYIIGAYIGAREFGIAKYLTPSILFWFVVFAILGTFMYGGLFVAAGAAVTNLKEAQSLITPIMLLVMLPMFVFGPVLNDPSGPIARTATFFPFSAPMMTVLRLGIPPGVQTWETILAAVITLLTTLAIVWAAGRIFRVGILMQGQPARPGQLLKWIVSG